MEGSWTAGIDVILLADMDTSFNMEPGWNQHRTAAVTEASGTPCPAAMRWRRIPSTLDKAALSRTMHELAKELRHDAAVVAPRLDPIRGNLLDAVRRSWAVPMPIDRFLGHPVTRLRGRLPTS